MAVNALVRGIKSAAYPSVTGGASVYGSHAFDLFKTDNSNGLLWFAYNEFTLLTDLFVNTNFGSRAGFTAAGQAAIPNVGDRVDIKFQYSILGHTGFTTLYPPIPTGTNIEKFNYYYKVNNNET